MFIIAEAERTCFACPSAWELKTTDGRSLYARYRWGDLTVREAEKLYETIFSKSCGDSLDGVMSFEELKEHMDGFALFECEESGRTIDPNDGYDMDALNRGLNDK